MLRVVDIEGKGHGYVAIVAARRGDVLLVDHGVPVDERNPAKTIMKLPNWRDYDGAQMGESDKERAMNVYQRNVFGEIHGSNTTEFFPRISFLNHSCLPNACIQPQVLRNKDKNNEIILYAINDIEPGEEVTICYMKLVGPAMLRRALLEKTYGFECQCSRCAAGDSEAERRIFAPLPDKSLVSKYHAVGDFYDRVNNADMAKESFRQIKELLNELPAEGFIRMELVKKVYSFFQLAEGKPNIIRNYFKDTQLWLTDRQIEALPPELSDHAAKLLLFEPLLELVRRIPSDWEEKHSERLAQIRAECDRLNALYTRPPPE